MSQALIIIDSDHPLARQNQCFDSKNEYLGCGFSFNVRLAKEASRRNIDIITADVYLEMKDRQSANVVCLTEMVSQSTHRLLACGVKPAICISLESPIIAKNFFHNFERFAGRFHHNYQFRGTQDRLANTETIFHPVVFPIDSRIPNALTAWNNRNYLIMVNSNKRATFSRWNNPRNIIHSTLAQIYHFTLQATDPWMRAREIYIDRIEAIHYFSKYNDFSLYGYGWELPIQGFGRKYQKAALRSYKGVISSDVRSKRKIMGGFKFALCFENCIFPGYITEKIVDCFLAGCVPVYFGAPDITDFIPAETFIDFRQFGNYTELNRFLRELSETDASHYLHAAREFLSSPAFDKFTIDFLVDDIITVIEQELGV